jgi:hypothetical protein
MSVEALAIVLNHSKARGAAKIVLMGIANHINPDNDGAWPSQAKLAGYANVSDRAVRDAVDVLVDLGELRYETAAGHSKTQYKPNRYWLTLSCPSDCDGTTNHRLRVEVSNTQGGSFKQSGWKPASDEPLIEPKEEPELKTYVQPKVEPRAEYTEQFLQFWSVFPRKTGKIKAQKAFVKALKLVSLSELIGAAKSYAADPNRSATYTKEAASWLNEGRWEDGPLPMRVMSYEERKEVQALASRKQTDAMKIKARELIEQSRKAAESATPPPKCQHGKTLAMCVPCSSRLS